MKHLAIAGAVGATALLLGQSASAAGTWAEEPIPPQQYQSSLHTAAGGDGVTWSFGIDFDGQEFRTQAFRRGQQGWEQVPAPNIGRVNTAAVVNRDDVWSVGDGRSMHWNGKQWQEVPLTSPPGTYTQYHGTKVFGAADVWAAGSATEATEAWRRGSIQHWDGKAWNEVPLPLDLGDWWKVSTIDGSSPNDLWAVGSKHVTVDGKGKVAGLILHWDGAQWQEQPQVDVPDWSVSLEDALVLAPDDVWAVGFRDQGTVARRPVALHWDGEQWSPGQVPDELGEIDDVVAGEGMLWAVGYDSNSPYVLRYDGRNWQNVPDPVPPQGRSVVTFSGVVLDDGKLLAVGAANAGQDDAKPYAAVYAG
ncbi:hypothetical protein [Saccharopolyspora sp. NPDC050642]|uniref:hypothetical protein n=1 Tax=Saccharopolyspora sp. NPDC050642 TaxID=3157099 RepID=UPI0033E9F3B1